ncbi:hypothetical protein MGSAQ_003071 [marine sediment metagenome]|uniref:Uncharacterized protein n=2 Tax=root TaxID=1 RepID=A0A1B6NPU9_9ZZZZ
MNPSNHSKVDANVFTQPGPKAAISQPYMQVSADTELTYSCRLLVDASTARTQESPFTGALALNLQVSQKLNRWAPAQRPLV